MDKKEYQKKWREQNRDKLLAQNKQWYEQNKDKNLARYVQRVAKIYATGPNYAKSIKSLMDDVKEIIATVKSYEIEKEEAKTSMVSQGV